MIDLGDLHQRTVLGAMLDADLDAQLDTAYALPEGTRLLDYEIVRLIGEGGFGIVYLAWDRVTKQHVAIKEYMPSVLASRATTSQLVILKSRRHAEHFRSGLRSFMYEARLLARFNHPSLVKVLRFWELNGTAYMAMPYHEGPTLGAVLEGLGRPASEQELRGWLEPLLDALRNMHAVSCYHRDISPDNILLTPGGPMLLDFGAARRVIGHVTQAPTVMIKPGFAPIEQYGDVASMMQGPWSDIYALAAVVYAAITGSTPVASISRLAGEHLEPLAELAAGHYSASFLEAVDEALSVFPENRPQSVADFRARLELGETDDAGTAPPPSAMQPSSPGPAAASAQMQELTPTPEQGAPQEQQRPEPQREEEEPIPIAGTANPPEDVPSEPVASPRPIRSDVNAASPLPANPARSSRARRKGVPAVAVLVLLAVAGVARFLAGGAPEPAAPTVASDPAPKPVATAPAPPALAKAEAIAAPKAASPAAPSNVPSSRPPAISPPAPAVAPLARVPAVAPVAGGADGASQIKPAATARAKPADARPKNNPPVVVASGGVKAAKDEARCNDMVQRASLEPISAGHARRLKKECQK